MIVRIKLPKALLRPVTEDSDQGPCRRRRRAAAPEESSSSSSSTAQRKKKRESPHSTASLLPFLVPVGSGGKTRASASSSSDSSTVTNAQLQKQQEEQQKAEAEAPVLKIVLQKQQEQRETRAVPQRRNKRREEQRQEAEEEKEEEEEVMHTTPQMTKKTRKTKTTRARGGKKRSASAKVASKQKREASPPPPAAPAAPTAPAEQQQEAKEEEKEEECEEECPLVVSTVTGGFTDVGGRGENQDSYFWLTEDEERGGTRLPCSAWGVLDGHGTNGATASATATRIIKQHLLDAFRRPQARAMTPKAAKALLAAAFQRAHEELISEAKLQPVETAESGTTATVAVLVPRGELVVGWTGDSMAIVHRVVPPSKRSPTRSTRSKKVYPRVLCRIEEHTLYHERECDRVEAAGGLITQQTATIRKLIPPGIDIATIRERRLAINMSRALGHLVLGTCGLIPDPEFTDTIALKPGDRLLLASDGLFKGQSTMDIASAACDYQSPAEAAAQLVQRSLAWDRENSIQSDNTTCVCVHFVAPLQPDEHKG